MGDGNQLEHLMLGDINAVRVRRGDGKASLADRQVGRQVGRWRRIPSRWTANKGEGAGLRQSGPFVY